MAILTVVGDRLATDSALAARVVGALTGFPLRMVSQAASRRNVTSCCPERTWRRRCGTCTWALRQRRAGQVTPGRERRSCCSSGMAAWDGCRVARRPNMGFEVAGAVDDSQIRPPPTGRRRTSRSTSRGGTPCPRPSRLAARRHARSSSARPAGRQHEAAVRRTPRRPASAWSPRRIRGRRRTCFSPSWNGGGALMARAALVRRVDPRVAPRREADAPSGTALAMERRLRRAGLRRGRTDRLTRAGFDSRHAHARLRRRVGNDHAHAPGAGSRGVRARRAARRPMGERPAGWFSMTDVQGSIGERATASEPRERSGA